MEERPVEALVDAGNGSQRGDEFARLSMTPRGRAFETGGAHQRQVDGRRGHQQTLVGADVRSRLAASDVLFPGLQGEGESGLAVAVQRAPDQASGKLPDKALPGADEAERRSSRGHGDAQRLAVATGDVGAVRAPFSRRLDDSQRHGVHHGDHEDSVRRRPIRDLVHRLEKTEEVRLLDDHGGETTGRLLGLGQRLQFIE